MPPLSKPGAEHPGEDYNCRCWAEPYMRVSYKPPVVTAPIPARKPEIQYPDAINPTIGPAEIFLGSVVGKAGLSGAINIYRAVEVKRLEELERLNRREWKFGKHKPKEEWDKLFKKREWTEEQVTETFEKGEKMPAPNKVNKQNEASTYRYKDRYAVKDEVTKELIQISGKDFEPEPMPKNIGTKP